MEVFAGMTPRGYTMRVRLALTLPSLLLATLSCAFAEESTPLAAAQMLFSAMKTHNASAAAALFVPGATLASVSAEGIPSLIPFEKFVDHIGSGKGVWVERIWNPQVLQRGPVAVVWAEYDFHLDGKFSHCGIDSFQLLKTNEGWKISAISDTREKTNCAPSPLGPL